MVKKKYFMYLLFVAIFIISFPTKALTIYLTDNFSTEEKNNIKNLVTHYLKTYNVNEKVVIKIVSEEKIMDEEYLFKNLKKNNEKAIIAISKDANIISLIGISIFNNRNVEASDEVKINKDNEYLSILDRISYLLYKFSLINYKEREL